MAQSGGGVNQVQRDLLARDIFISVAALGRGDVRATPKPCVPLCFHRNTNEAQHRTSKARWSFGWASLHKVQNGTR